jgi:hypothetical protein
MDSARLDQDKTPFMSNAIRLMWKAVNLANTCHSCMFLAGPNLPGADLNSCKLARRAKPMDG